MDANEQGAAEKGVPLLLLPGLICDWRIFAAQFAAFTDALAGADYGDATTLGAMADHVLADAPARFDLLGHSMGARVALEIMRRAPERVTRLALVSTGIHPRRDDEAAGRYRLRDLGRAAGQAALVDAWLPPMIGPGRTQDADLYGQLRAMCIDAGLSRFEAQTEALLSRPIVNDVLARIAVPTLVAVGADDIWSPPAQNRDIVGAIAGARLTIIPHAGHMLPAEQPDALNAAIAEWRAVPSINNVPEGEEK